MTATGRAGIAAPQAATDTESAAQIKAARKVVRRRWGERVGSGQVVLSNIRAAYAQTASLSRLLVT